MVWPWFSGEKEKGERLGFVQLVVAAAMGCFFGCFRIRNTRSNVMSAPKRPASHDNHALSSLFLSDGDLLRNRGRARNPQPEEIEARELKNEAKFLKACGTLPETPLEIRKASGNWVDMSDKNKESLNFTSWLPTASIEKLKLEKAPDQTPQNVKYCEEWVIETDCLVNTPSSCMTDGHNTRRNSNSSIRSSDIQNVIPPTDVPDNATHSSAISSVSPGVFATSVRGKTKSVRFESQSDNSTFSSETSSQCSKSSGSAGNSSESKPSPYPTPLKLTEEMQTPGTVFPAYSNNVADGKANRVRSQYVYSVLKPIGNPSIWKDFKNQGSDSNHSRESIKPNDEETSISIPISCTSIEEFSDEKDDPGFSWLKTQSEDQNGNSDQFDSISVENVHFGRTPGDRPILGIVAAHWNEEESSHISPKWWDGNGIPNSTNKYKEDQKVSWHATPFEERLEKALSKETSVSQRETIIMTPLFELNETEESDTASSQQHLKSIVSF